MGSEARRGARGRATAASSTGAPGLSSAREPYLAPAPLRPGPGHAPTAVEANQRGRLLGATIGILGREGWTGLTVRRICATAGVSSESFYKRFDNLEDCVAAGYEEVVGYTLRRARAARGSVDGRDQGTRAALASVLADAAAHPAAASAVLLGAYAGGPGMLLRIERGGRDFESFLAEGFDEEAAPAPAVLTAVVAGVARVIRTRAREGRLDELPRCAGPLGDWALALCRPCTRELGALGEVVVGRLGPSGRQAVLPPGWPPGEDEVRRRILAALVGLGAEHPYWELTSARIRAEARVTRREFDERFDGVPDCFLSAVATLLLAALEEAEGKAAATSSWEAGVYVAVLAVLRRLARCPVIGKLAFAELFEAGAEGSRMRAELVGLGAARLRARAPRVRDPGPVAAEATAAAAWILVRAQVLQDEPSRLPGLAPLIAYLVLAPTEGAAAALDAIGVEQGRIFGPPRGSARHRGERLWR